MSQGDQDKTEEPTPFRLEEARKRGEVAKSIEISGLAVMIVCAAVLALTAVDAAQALADAARRTIAVSGSVATLDAGFAQWFSAIYAPVLRAFTPLLLALLVSAVLGHLLQTGPMFTTHPLKPDFKRMNPMQTIKRIFSMRTLWELGKLTVKFGLLGALCWYFALKASALAEAVAMTLPQRFAPLLHSAFVRTSALVLLVLALVAVADFLFTRREFTKKMRMSRRELKDEIKRRDGDPMVKSKQKQQQRDLLKKTRALGKVAAADVVVTNPTHIAVALRYRPGETLAPVVVAKGAGLLAGRIRSIAARHRVPVVRAPLLARALYRECEIEGMVPPERYAMLAPIYRELWRSAPATEAQAATRTIHRQVADAGGETRA